MQATRNAKCKHCGKDFKRVTTEKYCSLKCAVFDKSNIGTDQECWEWKAAIGNHGYGVFSHMGVMYTSHRASYIAHFGSIQDAPGAHGGVVMHTCDNRKCVNPLHLKCGSQHENLTDCAKKFRYRQVVTPEQARQIKTRFRNGEKIGVIASSFGIKYVTTQAITSGRNYKYLEI